MSVIQSIITGMYSSGSVSVIQYTEQDYWVYDVAVGLCLNVAVGSVSVI